MPVRTKPTRKKLAKIVRRTDAPDIVTLPLYDRYFRNCLRRAIRADFERYPHGLPTYYELITSVVETHCAGTLEATTLGLKDLENFLKGMESHHPRIEILDAYIQISAPNLRSSFFPNRSLEKLGDAVAEFSNFENRTLSRPKNTFSGVFQFLSSYLGEERIAPPRFVVLRPSSHSYYSFYFEFEARFDRDYNGSENYNLRYGVCIPRDVTSVLISFEFLSRGPSVGEVDVFDGSISTLDNDIVQKVNFSLEAYTWSSGGENTFSETTHTTRSGTTRHRVLAEKVEDKRVIKHLEEIVDSFSGVI